MWKNTEDGLKLHYTVYFSVEKKQTKQSNKMHKPQDFAGKTVCLCNPEKVLIGSRMFSYYSEITLFETRFNPIC